MNAIIKNIVSVMFLLGITSNALLFSNTPDHTGALLIDNFEADNFRGYWEPQLNDLGGNRGAEDDADDPSVPNTLHPIADAISPIEGKISTERWLGDEADGSSLKITYQQRYDFPIANTFTGGMSSNFSGFCFIFQDFRPAPGFNQPYIPINLNLFKEISFWVYVEQGDFDFGLRLISTGGDTNIANILTKDVPIKSFVTFENQDAVNDWKQIKIPINQFLGTNFKNGGPGEGPGTNWTVAAFSNQIDQLVFFSAYHALPTNANNNSAGVFYIDNLGLETDEPFLNTNTESDSHFETLSVNNVFILNERKITSVHGTTNDAVRANFTVRTDIEQLKVKIFDSTYNLIFDDTVAGTFNAGSSSSPIVWQFIDRFGKRVNGGPYQVVLKVHLMLCPKET